MRLDLHTHSIISHDGGITHDQYRQLLADPNLCVAITDHNQVAFALELYQELGDKVIVGEEIRTVEGEIIGLFLNKMIPGGLSVAETIQHIRDQGGLVYVPHPFEKTRHGLSYESLQSIAGHVDLLEIFNARSHEPWLSKKSEKFAQDSNIIPVASSDAHSVSGFGTAFCSIAQLPHRDNFLELMKNSNLEKNYAPLLSLLAPAFNKLKKKISR